MTAPALEVIPIAGRTALRVLLPTIDPAASAHIAAEIAAGDPALECGFVARYDMAARTITSATLVMRGCVESVRCVQSDLRPGEVFLHNHPIGCPLPPSETDLDVARALGELGIGFAICDHSAELLYMVREPLPPRIDRARWRWFSIRRLTIGWDTGKPSTSSPR